MCSSLLLVDKGIQGNDDAEPYQPDGYALSLCARGQPDNVTV